MYFLILSTNLQLKMYLFLKVILRKQKSKLEQFAGRPKKKAAFGAAIHYLQRKIIWSLKISWFPVCFASFEGQKSWRRFA